MSGQVFAINPNGTLKWNLTATYASEGGWSPAVSSDGIIFIADYSKMRAINPDGTIKWERWYQGSEFPTSPAIGQDGTVYFVGGGSSLLALGNPSALPQATPHCPASPSQRPKNNVPAFISVPHDMKVEPGKKILITIMGEDQDTLDDGHLRYSLIQAPKGMSIDPTTGQINWSPKKADVGQHTIVIGLTDGIDNVTTFFNITIRPEPVSGIFRTVTAPRGILIWSLSLFIIVIGVALVGGTEVGVFGMYSFVLLLYTRLKGEKILDNFIRGQLYGMILEWPGSSFSELKRKMKRPTGTVAYHLQALEKEEMIKSVSRGTKKLFFPSTFIVSDEYFTLTDAQRVVYNVVKVNPGISQKGIAKRTGFKTSRINKIIHRLSERGMLDIVKGKTTQCYVQGDQLLKDLEPVTDG